MLDLKEDKCVNIESYLQKAQLLEKENRVKDAIAIYQQAIEPQVRLALAYSKQSHWQQAIYRKLFSILF